MAGSNTLLLASVGALAANFAASQVGGVAGLGSSARSINFILGNISFNGLAAPEMLDKLGGTQVAAFHDYPGGTRTFQTFGAFPDPISWSGILVGPNAFDTAQAIDRIRIAGRPVALSYERFGYEGVVTHFNPKPKHQWYVPYEIHFMPTSDLSGGASPPSVFNDTFRELLQQLSFLSDLYAGEAANLLALPATLSVPVSNVILVTNAALTAANNSVDNISAHDSAVVQAALAELKTAAAPLIISTDPTQSSPALDAVMSANAIGTVINSVSLPRWQVQSINPNLLTLAAQYLGDSSRWRDIAALNGLNDPQPVGQFNIRIPPP